MFHTKFMLFSVVALMTIGSAIAIINGKDALRRQFPYFAYLKTFEAKSAWSWRSAVNLFNCFEIDCGTTFIANQLIIRCVQTFSAQIPYLRWITRLEPMDFNGCSMLGALRWCRSTFGCRKIIQSK